MQGRLRFALGAVGFAALLRVASAGGTVLADGLRSHTEWIPYVVYEAGALRVVAAVVLAVPGRVLRGLGARRGPCDAGPQGWLGYHRSRAPRWCNW